MKVLLDMNISPSWKDVLKEGGFEVVHWSDIGSPDAPDTTVMAWARAHGYVIFTHDLDFGTLLALSNARTPSVFQVRTQNVTPQHLARLVVSALRQFEETLHDGALVTVDEGQGRARVLPFR
ncbi:MAG: hypothetical protein HW380_1105 [Magnetococcales bacterium]|nr:hypothetical protein [Magnetococcales bacterium]HIJ82808.1 DUF5615 family PIN-like protein [Magnetococcales bacterium]